MNEDFKEFFIDTADVGYINDTLYLLAREDYEILKHFKGVTTNPNAMAKVGSHSLAEWMETLSEILRTLLMHKINTGPVELHIQLPNTQSITTNEVAAFVNKLHGLCELFNEEGDFDGKLSFGLKISPLQLSQLWDIKDSGFLVNVTGCADYASILRAASYEVDYASLIPGRMEERGINANAHMSYLKSCNLGTTKVITGSMRTVAGLKNAFAFGTIPTIGTRVWDEIFKKRVVFRPTFLESLMLTPSARIEPVLITGESQDLTNEFFDSMDDLGLRAYMGVRLLV